MKTLPADFRPLTAPALVCAVLLALLTPSTRVHSQLAPLPSDPSTAIQALQQANADLLRRQETTLKELDEMATTAREVRIFTRRG